MKKFVLLFLLFLTAYGHAQFSKTHYIPPLSNSNSIPAEEQYLYISTPSLVDVNFRIINIGGEVIHAVVSRDSPYVYYTGIGSSTQLMIPSAQTGNVISNKGYIIEADDLVYVTVRLMATSGFHAGAMVSKGLAALGTEFRVGAMINTLMANHSSNHYTFISVLATENNTTVNFSDMKPGIQFVQNTSAGNTDFSVVLNSGQSYVVAVQGPNQANRDGLIGSLVTSDKPIAMACGSFGGTNGELSNIDLGFDQIVPSSRVGSEYIFIKSTGSDNVERVLLVANEDDTQIFLNGSIVASATLNAGEYASFNGTSYTPQGNLYVESSKNIFAYQSVGDDGQQNQANQEMFFVPPLSCQTPKIIDNIPLINKIGNTTFTGRITLVTETGSDLSFVLNGQSYTLNNLPNNININGPLVVTGRPDFVTYTISGMSGNVSVYSTSQLYLASYGSFDNATFGGFYSGFTYKPSISFTQVDVNQDNCFPNIRLSVSEASGFDSYEWFFNGNLVSTATSFIPTAAGYYYVRATLAACGTTLESDLIPVSNCGIDSDNDGANDNIDIDLDNDGITNCDESFGTIPIDLSLVLTGNFGTATDANSFIASTQSDLMVQEAVTGDIDGSFSLKTNQIKFSETIYNFNFTNPVSIKLDYVQNTEAENLLNSNSEFIVNSSELQTLTLLNPDNQLLVDTNYDGFYESGVTQFSSFEIRFRLNSTTPLAAGTGTFSLQTFLASKIKITHRNLSDSFNSAAFRLQATCMPRDSDNDGVDDYLDFDSDNDGIPDQFESANLVVTLLGTDANGDGLDDVYGDGIVAADSDNDGIPNYLDLDSDNDGMYDVVESGSGIAHINAVITSPISANGLAIALQTSNNSGVLNYTVADTNSDGIINAFDLDSDGDLCTDVIEAGFPDDDNDGMYGTGTPNVNAQGLVIGASYLAPNSNYITPTPIDIINDVPAQITICTGDAFVLSITTNPEVTYQWQVATGTAAFVNITDDPIYSGSNTANLQFTATPFSYNGNRYRVILDRAGNLCGSQSGETIINVNMLPAAVTKTLVQCEVGANPDGITLFDLSQATPYFTNNLDMIEVVYFATLTDAQNDQNQLPIMYENTVNFQNIIAKVLNGNDCANYSTLILESNLLPSPIIDLPALCDYDGLEDGIATFNLTTPFGSTGRYYLSDEDALLEQNEILNPLAYQNITPYQAQTIFVRRESNEDCISITLLNIRVNPLPDIDVNLDLQPHVVCVNSTQFTTTIDAAILDGSAPADYTYQWFFDGAAIPGATAYTLTLSQHGEYSVVVTNEFGCSKTRFIPVIASSTAIIESVVTTGFLENNSVTVTLSDNSYGDYVYAIDYQNAFQSSNVLTNVLPGIHTLYVKDLNGCPVASQVFSVLGIPKYFTPNGDGFNETWNIQGVGYAFYPETVTYVYDRYGKLIKQILATEPGWDGTFEGKPLMADDYWYVITMADGQIYKGHFSLKR